MEFALLPHPAFPPPAGISLSVDVQLAIDGAFILGFHSSWVGSLLAIPSAIPSIRTDELWRHTCCELFLADSSGRYREFNFSPSSAWACYDFSAYRQRTASLPAVLPPEIEFSQSSDGWHMLVCIDWGAVDGFDRIGLTAVVEAADGSLSYWAVTHPAEKPDFHDPKGFSISYAALDAAPNNS